MTGSSHILVMVRQAVTLGGRGPKMSVPMRTRVAPSATAAAKSPDMPMERWGSGRPVRARKSSRRRYRRAK